MGVFVFPCVLWQSYSRTELLLGRMSLFVGAASPCWCFVNYRSRDETCVHGYRMGHSPSWKSPAAAQPGALAAFCVSPVSFPLCTDRGCHPILKRMPCFPSQHTKEQLPQPDSGRDVWWTWRFILSPCFPSFCSISSAYQPWPEAGGLWQPQVCSSMLFLYPMFSCFYWFVHSVTNAACSKICHWLLRKFLLPEDASARKVASCWTEEIFQQKSFCLFPKSKAIIVFR